MTSGPCAGYQPLREALTETTLFETPIIVLQLRLFDLGEVLGEEGGMKVLKLDEYAPRRPDKLQQVLFSYTEAI
jgi:hypothetical protein